MSCPTATGGGSVLSRCRATGYKPVSTLRLNQATRAWQSNQDGLTFADAVPPHRASSFDAAPPHCPGQLSAACCHARMARRSGLLLAVALAITVSTQQAQVRQGASVSTATGFGSIVTFREAVAALWRRGGAGWGGPQSFRGNFRAHCRSDRPGRSRLAASGRRIDDVSSGSQACRERLVGPRQGAQPQRYTLELSAAPGTP